NAAHAARKATAQAAKVRSEMAAVELAEWSSNCQTSACKHPRISYLLNQTTLANAQSANFFRSCLFTCPQLMTGMNTMSGGGFSNHKASASSKCCKPRTLC